MAIVNVKIDNMPQIKSAFKQSPAEMTKNLTKALNRSGLKIGGTAAMFSPTDTGRLRASIVGGSFRGGSFKTNVGIDLAHSQKLSVTVGTNVAYAEFVHEGTKFMKARPFLKDAVEVESGYIQAELDVAVQDTLNTLARRMK